MISDSLKQSLGALTNTFNPDILLSSSTQLDNKDLIRNFLIKLSVELLSSMSPCPKLSNSTITPAVCALTWCNTANTSLQIDCGLKDREHITFKVYINGKEWSEFTTKDNEIFLAALEAINACGFQATEDAENIAKYAPIGAIEYMEQDILEYPALVNYNFPRDVYTNRRNLLCSASTGIYGTLAKVKHLLPRFPFELIFNFIVIALSLAGEPTWPLIT